MSRFKQTLPAAYFDTLYAADPDPWRFETSAYEREKYAATLAALPRPQYGSALEVGCSTGVLTRQLTDRCASLLSIDGAAAALEQARTRCADVPHVAFAQMHVPGDWPRQWFDLVMLSEVVYYLDRLDIGRLAARVTEVLMPDGDVMLVHWLGTTNYPLSGDEAADAFIAASVKSLRLLHQFRTAEYRLDLLRSTKDPASAKP